MEKKQAKKRIVFIINDLSVGGAQKMLLTTVKFYKRKHEMHVVSLLDLPGKSLKKQIEKYATVSQFQVKRLFNPITWLKILKEVKDNNPDLIISHMFIANLFSRIIGFILGIRVVVFEHNVLEGRTALEKTVDSILSHISHKICAVSEAVRKDLVAKENISPKRIEIIPNTVEFPERSKFGKSVIKKRLGISGDSKVILSVSRIVPQKDIPFMVKVMFHAVKMKQDLALYILGEGKDRGKVKKFISRYGLEGNVILAGFKDPRPYYEIADLYLNTSRKEGMAISLLEASSYSLPIVAADVGGNSEIIKNGTNGYIMKSRDPKSFAKAAVKILNSQRIQKRMRKNAGLMIEKFSTEHYHSNLSAVVDSTMQMPRRVFFLL